MYPPFHFTQMDIEPDLPLYSRVKRLTADQLDNYTIYDVVMPLPGCQVQYPLYNGGENWLEDILKQDDITLEQLDHRVKYV